MLGTNNATQSISGYRQHPFGKLPFDLIEKKVSHSSGTHPKLWITGELGAWLKTENCDGSKLVFATLEVQYKTDRIKTDRSGKYPVTLSVIASRL